MAAEFEPNADKRFTDESDPSSIKTTEIDPMELSSGEIRKVIVTALFQSMFFPKFDTEIYYRNYDFDDTITSEQLKILGEEGTTQDVDEFINGKVMEISNSCLLTVTTRVKPEL